MAASGWTLMDAHGLTLFYIATSPTSTMREVSEAVGLTERRTSQIIRDLAEADMLRITKVGRRNVYSVNRHAGFPHPTFSHITVGKVVEVIQGRI